jgi:hypothetical protein
MQLVLCNYSPKSSQLSVIYLSAWIEGMWQQAQLHNLADSILEASAHRDLVNGETSHVIGWAKVKIDCKSHT